MKVVTVVGARPQFIKASALSRVLRKEYKEVLVHTGQHYDRSMSDVFFEELGVPVPDYFLSIGSASHGKQTGAMMASVENVLLKEKPDAVIVYGDTNSTLAGSLAAVKLHIPVVHVEAGLRSFNNCMPEEINRKLTDHISTILFCPSSEAKGNLKSEGILNQVHVVGDIMHDVLCHIQRKNKNDQAVFEKYNILPKEYNLLTLHRAENTDVESRLLSIFKALELSDDAFIFPMHPRTKMIIERLGIKFETKNIQVISPVGYYEMITMLKNANMVLTDSGGIQKEAYWLKTPCITLRDETEWGETVLTGWNCLVGANTNNISQALESFSEPVKHPDIYGDGNTAQCCVTIMNDYFK